MRAHRSLIPLALALFAARCADHPTAVQQPLMASFTPGQHGLAWKGGAAPPFAANGAVWSHPNNGIIYASGLSLGKDTVSFWAVRGQQRSLQIYYASDSSQFLGLTVTDPTYAPARGALALGDSVLITVTVDPQTVKVSLAPTGLVFGNPAQFQLSYRGANGDLNGDGVVNATDAYIESQLLGLWYREGVDSAWAQIPAVHDLAGKSFTSALPHFCDYAFSW